MYESLIGNYKDADFYDRRKKYMLERVDDAYNERSLDAKLGKADTEATSANDASTLRDDKPKKGKAVTLRRDFSTVDDDLISRLDAIARTDTINDHEETDRWGKTTDTDSLKNLRTLLGRVNGQAGSILDSIYEAGNEYSSGTQIGTNQWIETVGGDEFTRGTTTVKTADFGLNADEKKRLKEMDRRTLLDRFFGTDTSKY